MFFCEQRFAGFVANNDSLFRETLSSASNIIKLEFRSYKCECGDHAIECTNRE